MNQCQAHQAPLLPEAVQVYGLLQLDIADAEDEDVPTPPTPCTAGGTTTAEPVPAFPINTPSPREDPPVAGSQVRPEGHLCKGNLILFLFQWLPHRSQVILIK